MVRVPYVAALVFCVGCGGWFAKKEASPQPTVVDERVHFQLGKQFFREHQAEEVIGRYEELLAANPEDVATLNNLAWSLATAPDVTLRDTERAVQLARKASDLSQEKEPEPLDTLAHCYFYDGQLDLAITTEGRAAALAPGNDAYRRALATFRQAGAERAAQERLRTFTGEGSAVEVELVPGEEPEPEPKTTLPPEAQAHLEEAQRLLGRREWDQARTALEQIITQVPDYAPAYNYLGAVAARTGTPTEAVRFYEQAIELDPQFAPAWNNLAWLLATVEDEVHRDPLRAVASALKAVELTNSGNADMLDTLAEAYFAAGRLQEAVEAEQKALGAAGGDKAHFRRQLERFIKALDASTQ